jgi:hypothetical protein
VINRKDLEKAQAQVNATCGKRDYPCPEVGACPGHVYVCLRGQCAMVMEGSPDWANVHHR